jgi:hypothetical protein
VTGIPEYGAGRHEDYLSQRDERAEVARDLQAEEVTREFAGWAEAQGYDDSELYSFAEMDEAFAAGMQAARDLDAAQERPARFGATGGPQLRLALCGDHPGEAHAQILDHPAAGLDAWVCLRQLADVAESDASEVTVQPAAGQSAPGVTVERLAATLEGREILVTSVRSAPGGSTWRAVPAHPGDFAVQLLSAIDARLTDDPEAGG